MLRRASVEILMVSITGDLQVTGAHNITVSADTLFHEVDFSDADLLVLPGGMPGTTRLMEHEGLDKLLRSFNKEKKHIAAICAAPSVLGNKGILSGKSATCYPGLEDQLIGSTVIERDVVEDDNVITSQGLGTAIDFSLSIISKLLDKKEAEKIAESIMYKRYE